MITLKNVTKEFHLDEETSITPVVDVSLEVQRGEFVMIVGRSGSGKTTLLNLCAGLIKPSSGQVIIDGKDIQTLDEKGLSELRSTKIGFVFQSASMLPSLSVIENVAAPSMFSHNGKTEDRFGRAAEVLELVGLSERMEVLPRQLSGGELRRVAIARALMNRPEILLADEPTSDLDVQTELKIVAALQRIHGSGVTVVMVTHSLELVPYATRALKMEDGKLVPLQDSQAQSLRLGMDAAVQPSRELQRRSVPARSSPLRGPVLWGFAGLGLALLAMTLAFGIMVGRDKGASPTARPATTSAPGPVLPSTNAMGMTVGSGTYDPTQYNLYGNTGMYSSAMMGAQWPVQVDPPPGDPFKDPPVLEDLDPAPAVFAGKLEAKVAAVKISDTVANLLTYNGSYPGPVIKVKRGDTLKIAFTNSLPATTETNILGYEKNHTNLHTHGFHVSPQEPSDNVMVDLAPGESYNYEYDLSLQTGGTLNFMHPHVHGLVAEQLWGGMLAPIVVEDEVPALSSYESHIIVLKDITLEGNEPQAHLFMTDFLFGKEGNIVTVNGQVNPMLPIKPGQVQRWRILNGSNARFYRVYLENHILYLVGTEGGLLDKPYPVSSLLLAPGERADVLVKASTTTGNYKFVSLPYSRQMGMMGMGMSGMSMVGQSGNMAGATSGLGMGMGITNSVNSLTTYDPTLGVYSGLGMYGGMALNGARMYGGMYNPGTYASWPAVTKLLDLAPAQIQALLAQGNSLAEIAATKGISESQLVEAILTQSKANLDQYVLNGYLTQQQASQQLSWIEQSVRQVIADKAWRTMIGRVSMASGMSSTSMADPSLAYAGTYGTCGGTTTSGVGSTGNSAMGSMGVVGPCPGMIGTIGMGRYDMSASTQVTLMTVSCKGSAVSDELPGTVNAAAQRLTMDLNSLPKRVLAFDMDMGNGYVNGLDYDVQPLTIQSQLGTYEVWQIVNHSGMDHPFHVHLNSFQVLAINGGDVDYAQLYTTTPSWKDVIIVPKMGSVILLMPVQDYAGMAMFHCHILEHEDIGMMGQWEIVGQGETMSQQGTMGQPVATAQPGTMGQPVATGQPDTMGTMPNP